MTTSTGPSRCDLCNHEFARDPDAFDEAIYYAVLVPAAELRHGMKPVLLVHPECRKKGDD